MSSEFERVAERSSSDARRPDRFTTPKLRTLASLSRAMTDYLQKRFAPKNKCFGCGPANAKGLRIESRVEGDTVVVDWTPEEHHEAFPGVVNGGIVGALFDCGPRRGT